VCALPQPRPRELRKKARAAPGEADCRSVKKASSLSAESWGSPLLVSMTTTGACRGNVSVTLVSVAGEFDVRIIVRQTDVSSTRNSRPTTRSSQPPAPIPSEDVLTTTSAGSRSAGPTSSLP